MKFFLKSNYNINISNDEFDKEKSICVLTILKQMNSTQYFKPKTGENYLFIKLIEMLIDENKSLKDEIEKLKKD